MSIFKILIFIFIIYFIYSAFKVAFAVKRGMDELRNNNGPRSRGTRGGGAKDSSNTIELDHDQYKVE